MLLSDNMYDRNEKEHIANKWLKLAGWCILVAGVVLRLVVYLQNRDLMLDEANVARNIYERDLPGLVKPLSYEQYAPPVFLWMVKLSSLLFGFGEQALRVYPLIAGILSLFLFNKVVKEIAGAKAAWYPMLLFALAPILIRYSSELKQYMPDVCITLLLLLAALKTDIRRSPRFKFMLQWLLIGSAAIWSSMPSVFLLAGIGCYYGTICIQHKDNKKLFTVAATSMLWLAQFGIYYFAILRPQISSDYLQNFHQYDFLFATPSTGKEWMHNWTVLSRLPEQFARGNYFVFVNTALLLLGIIILLLKQPAKGLLLSVPLLCLLLAAALNQFSLMPRVALFSLPVILLLCGAGFSFFMNAERRPVKLAAILVVVPCALLSIGNSSGEKYKYEQLTEGLKYLQVKNIEGKGVYIHHSAGPAYIYYSQIHPGKVRLLNNASVLAWNTNYDSLAWQLKNVRKENSNVAFVFTNATMDETDKRRKGLAKHLLETGQFDKKYVRVYIYDTKAQ